MNSRLAMNSLSYNVANIGLNDKSGTALWWLPPLWPRPWFVGMHHPQVLGSLSTALVWLSRDQVVHCMMSLYIPRFRLSTNAEPRHCFPFRSRTRAKSSRETPCVPSHKTSPPPKAPSAFPLTDSPGHLPSGGILKALPKNDASRYRKALPITFACAALALATASRSRQYR
jgi:hypothetical protein